MAFDAGLAERVREALGRETAFGERRMFGGLCILVEGNMCAGIIGESLMVRVGPMAYADALEQPHCRVMDFTGKPLKGLVYVDPRGFAEDADLEAWLGRGLAFVRTLPPK